ncbi:hypothetical protein F511_44028 [Dorcoceras hygrometricum]|uniref:Uncharacterized protein n=1 Tax=Dorcoceras hygrometricum TaxID=472368 RepID=A0A2Z7BB33_9LAMI|nr:hypothetical protein F511_44028 [Dorcoceras hygrometricum]
MLSKQYTDRFTETSQQPRIISHANALASWPEDLDNNLLNTQHIDLKSCTETHGQLQKLTAGSHAQPTQLLPKQLTVSLNQGYEQDLITKERSSTCTTKRTIGQQLRIPQLANHSLQKVVWNDRASQEESNATSNVSNNGRKRWELPEKSYCEQ